MPYVAYKFRLYPNATQERELLSQLETLRQVYNTALRYWRDLYAAEKRSPKRGELYKVFAALRNLQAADAKAGGPGPHWLTKVAAVAMRDTLKRVEAAFKHFFRRVKAGEKPGYPRFKGYGRLGSIPFDNYNSGCALRDREGRVVRGDLPADRLRGCRLDVFGAGRVRVKAHRAVEGTVKTVTVTREPDGRWHVVLVCEQPQRAVEPKQGPAVGVDVGLEHFLTTSDGEHVPNPRVLKASLKKLRRLQRSASRKAERAKKAKRRFRECRNLQKAFHKVARLHGRVKRLRKEHHHKVAKSLVDRYGTVCVESLNVRGMVRNGKMARAVADAGWAGFRVVLKHKAERAGVRCVEVDPRGTSQECPECGGEVWKDLKVRRHACPHCGYEAHRDHAAARVILRRGCPVADPPARAGPAGRNAGVGPRAPGSPSVLSGPVRPRERGRGTGSGRGRKAARSRTGSQPSLFDGVA